MKDLLSNVGSGGGAAAPAAGAAASGGAAAAEEAKAEEKVEGQLFPPSHRRPCQAWPAPAGPENVLTRMIATEKEESDEDMGFGLFD